MYSVRSVSRLINSVVIGERVMILSVMDIVLDI